MNDIFDFQNLFQMDYSIKTPLYKQLIKNILANIQNKNLNIGDKLPSINSICKEFNLSRDTVIKSYIYLKEKGIITSVHGKGFYINNSIADIKKNVFMLVDAQHTSYKEQLLKGMNNIIDGRANLEVFSHHYNPVFFRDIVNKYKNDFEYYVIMPFEHDLVFESITKLDPDKVLLLDIAVNINHDLSYIFQSHDVELEKALAKVLTQIKKYKKFVLVYPEERHHPASTKSAFIHFCEKNKIDNEIVHDMNNKHFKKKIAYFLIEDDDLVSLIKFTRKNKVKLGIDIGCITYNDTPFKEIIEGGITTVSIDFNKMGQLVGRNILNPAKINISVPTNLILRNSL